MKTPKTLPRKNDRPAQAAVEFALVLPILLLLIYGMIEVGRMIFIYANVVSAARLASRYGAAVGQSQTAGVPLYQDCAGIRAAAQRSDFMGNFSDQQIKIWHDSGEGNNETEYCKPGQKTDRSFQPSGGNSSRLRVQISADFTPLLSFIPLEPFAISSISARTILVSVPVQIGDETKRDYIFGTPAPTMADGVSDPPGPQKPSRPVEPACDPRHSRLAVSPFGMTVYNHSPSLTLHIRNVQVWGPASAAGQTLKMLTLGGASIWSGSLPDESPAYISDLAGDRSIPPRSSKFLQVGFGAGYRASGAEKIVVVFEEKNCPKLDSSNASQLP